MLHCKGKHIDTEKHISVRLNTHYPAINMVKQAVNKSKNEPQGGVSIAFVRYAARINVCDTRFQGKLTHELLSNLSYVHLIISRFA